MSTGKVFLPEYLYRDGELHSGEAVHVDGEGNIAAVGPIDQVATPDLHRIPLAGRVLLPGLVNGHSHCWQVLLRGLGRDPANFHSWVSEQLYPTVERLDPDLFKAAARLCFAQMVQSGITTCGEFHYIHRGPGGEDVGDLYDHAVLDAAQEVGIRLTLARTMYDQGEKEGQKRFQESPDEAADAVRRLAAHVADRPTQTVLPAPHSLHGASREMLEAADEVSAELETRFHIHLAEQRSDLEFSQEAYGHSPLRALESLGLLDERTTLVHGIWLDEGEITMLAAAGGALVYNPWTNMLLADGTAPLPAYLQTGAIVGLGTDANAIPDILLELRAAEYLQRIRSLEMNRLPPTLEEGESLLDLATRGGAEALGLDVGALEPGTPADMVSLRLDVPSMAPASRISAEAILHQILYVARPLEVVDRVWVAGELIADGGTPTRVSPVLLSEDLAQRAAACLDA